jgi:hypothetical protein
MLQPTWPSLQHTDQADFWHLTGKALPPGIRPRGRHAKVVVDHRELRTRATQRDGLGSAPSYACLLAR